MMMQSLSSAAMEKAMDGVWQRYQLVASNLANEDTPGYKAKRVDFETELQKELVRLRGSRTVKRQSALERVNSLEPTFYEDESTIQRADENNVDVQAEQIELARVQLQYQMLAQNVSSYYANLKYAITGGK